MKFGASEKTKIRVIAIPTLVGRSPAVRDLPLFGFRSVSGIPKNGTVKRDNPIFSLIYPATRGRWDCFVVPSGLLAKTSISIFQLSLFFLCSVLFVSIACGQMNVLSEPSGADVLIDSAFVGKTPLLGFTLSEGKHVIKVFYPSLFAWNSLVKAETIHVSPDRAIEKIFELGSVLTISSVPAGGKVTYQGLELGTTPLYVRSPSRFSDELLVQKEGYNEERVALNAQAVIPLTVLLQPTQSGESAISADVLSNGQNNGVSNHWLTYTSGASMIVSGVLSAYFKDKANRDFDGYLLSNDPALLSSTRRLDRWAAATLVISQISFAILAYVLLSE